MSKYFTSWRRRIGVLVLVLACLFLAGWVRSLSTLDRGTSHFNRSMYGLTSYNSRIHLLKLTPLATGAPILWSSQRHSEPLDYWFEMQPVWRWDWAGFQFGAANSKKMTEVRMDIWTIPYWAVVVPLTLLSTFLLLSRRRVLNSEPAFEAAPCMVT